MRAIPVLAAGFLTAVTLVSFGPSARADSNDFMGQAQRFLNNGNNGNDNRDAYQRGREDELRRQQARQDHDRDRHDDGYRNDAYRGDRGRGSDYNYNSNYR
jgi:hypothetical protein